MRVLTSATAPPRDQDAYQDGYQDAGPAGEADDQWWEGGQPEVAPLTYETAAEQIPDDPDPARMPASSTPPAGEIRVTRAILRDIEGKMAFWGSVGVDMWNMVDPYCAGAAADNIDKMARKGAPLICQSPQLVAFFVKSTTFMQWTEFLMACKPVAVAIIAHHITKRVQLTKGTDGETQTQEADWSAYTAA